MSNSIVVYLRLLTSAEIKSNADYAAFLLHPETGEQMDPESFCNHFVEAVGKEAGEFVVVVVVPHISVAASVATALQHVPVSQLAT